MQPAAASPPTALRRGLDALYHWSGVLAAVALAGTCTIMLVQVVTRETGILFRGADDIVAWLCAASAFLALGHTFRRGELVRMMLAIERLEARRRWWAEVFALGVTTLFVGYMLYAVVGFVWESWKFNEVAQGLIRIPIWIPQISFIVGVAVFFIAVVDEFVAVLSGRKPAYILADEERRARGDFSETV